MSMSVVMSASVEGGLKFAAMNFGREVIGELGRRGLLKCSVLEAVELLNDSSIVSSRSFASKKREGLKVAKSPSMVLPCCGEIVDGNCLGVKFNHGLHTQCVNGGLKDGEYCKTCQKNADCSATGKPLYGDIRERVKHGVDYRDPKGKLTIPYANVVEKLGLNLEAAHLAASELGWTIPAEQLVKRTTKRGRPAKSAAVSDTDSDTSEVPKKKRGRKPKAAKKAVTEEDQIAVLVAEAYADSGDKIQALCNEAKKEAASDNVASKTLKEAEKVAKKEAIEAKKAEKEAEKVAKKEAIEAKKAKKEAEKVAKKEAIEADKLAKKEAIEAKKAEKLAKKEAIEAEKLAKKEAIEAKKAEKLAKKEAIETKKAEKAAAKAEKAAAKAEKAAAKAEKAAKAAKAAEPKEELETEDVDEGFEKMEVDGVKYIKQVDEDSGHIGLYHVDTGEPVGIYDPVTKLIEECDVESDDEE
jgi:hypothetical protein